MSGAKYEDHHPDDLPGTLYLENTALSGAQSLSELPLRRVSRVPHSEAHHISRVHPIEYTAVPNSHTHAEVELRADVEGMLQEARKVPIEHYEELLRSCIQTHGDLLAKAPISFRGVCEVHHILQLQKTGNELSEPDRVTVAQSLDSAVHANPSSLAEYQLFASLADLSSGLLACWQISHYTHFAYRDQRTVNSYYDPCSLTEAILSMDTFWFVCAVREQPFVSMASESLLHASQQLEVSTLQLFSYLLDFPISHISLHLPTGLFSICRRASAPVIQLKSLLRETESRYRHFEAALISACAVDA